MFYEFQLAVSELRDLLVSQVRASPETILSDRVGPGFVCGVTVGTPTFDTLSGTPLILQAADGRVRGRRLRARVPLTACLVAPEALREAGHRPTAEGLSLTAEAVLEFGVVIEHSVPLLVVELLNIVPADPLEADRLGISDRLDAARFRSETPLASLGDRLHEVLLGELPAVRVAAVAADLIRGIAAVRIELAVGEAETAESWDRFLAGEMDNHLDGAPFALFASAGLIERAVRGALPEAAAALRWAPEEGQPRLALGPDEDGASIALDLTVEPGATEASLTLWAQAGADPCFVDALCAPAGGLDRELGTELALSVIGFVLFPRPFPGGPPAATPALEVSTSGAVLLFLGSLLVGALRGLFGDVTVPAPQLQRVSDSTLAADLPARFATPSGEVRLIGISGEPEGLVLRGRFEAVSSCATPELHLEPPRPFRWNHGGYSGARLVPTAVLRLHNPSTATLYVTSVRSLTDGFSAAFERPVAVAPGAWRSIEVVGAAEDSSELVLLPAICDVLLQTTGGTRLVSVPLAPATRSEQGRAPRTAQCVLQLEPRAPAESEPMLVPSVVRRALG